MLDQQLAENVEKEKLVYDWLILVLQWLIYENHSVSKRWALWVRTNTTIIDMPNTRSGPPESKMTLETNQFEYIKKENWNIYSSITALSKIDPESRHMCFPSVHKECHRVHVIKTLSPNQQKFRKYWSYILFRQIM